MILSWTHVIDQQSNSQHRQHGDAEISDSLSSDAVPSDALPLDAVPLDDLASDDLLLEEFRNLWADAEEIWDRLQNEPAFHAYVSADYEAVFAELAKLRGRVSTVLECGSGLGVVAIMASRMGFDACGIEAETGLIEFAEELSEKYESEARFAAGSFIPDDFEWTPSNGDESIATFIDVADGYQELDMELRDFDLIYAYPWPDEHYLFHNFIGQLGNPDAIFLSYDAREGIHVKHFGS